MGCRKSPAIRAIGAALAFALTVSAGARAEEKPDLRMAAALASPINQLPAAPANGEMAFVFSDFTPGIYPGWDSCPHGWAFTNREQYLATLSPSEKARLLKPENEEELTTKWKASTTGPGGSNICTNYNQFPDRPLQASVQSKIAFGLNLHGAQDVKADDPYFCPHQSFSSPTGETGIDNQHYRALGCTRVYRGTDGGPGQIGTSGLRQMSTGEYTFVLILRGLDSLVNDKDVEVILASSHEQPIVDPQKNFIRDASYHVTDNPRWRHVLHGRVENGVLITEAKDILLLRARGIKSMLPKPEAGTNWEWDFERAKLRLAFRPDGTLQGEFGGFEHPLDILHHAIGGGRGTAQTAGMDCASMYNTLTKLADGSRDPKTGQCTRVSAGYLVSAVPAFVFDTPPASTRSADAR